MSDYDNTNSGALFKNARKVKDTHPDYNGQINVGGTEYWLSAWLKKSKKGETYMSLSIKAKTESAKPPRTAPPEEKFEDEQIPF
jgi:uncharacterized protein (DUF736 family)